MLGVSVVIDEVQCPICGINTEVDRKSWFYTCTGCGSGINMIGIWWKEKTGNNWLELSQKEKKIVSDSYFSRDQGITDWKNVLIEL